MSPKKIKERATLSKEFERCWYCGVSLEGMEKHRDHIVPTSQGGSDDLDNKALTCGQCNRAKLDSDLISYLMWLAHIRSSAFECYIIKKLGVKLGNNVNDKLQKSFYKK